MTRYKFSETIFLLLNPSNSDFDVLTSKSTIRLKSSQKKFLNSFFQFFYGDIEIIIFYILLGKVY